jgi:hypothetical protein
MHEKPGEIVMGERNFFIEDIPGQYRVFRIKAFLDDLQERVRNMVMVPLCSRDLV